MLFDRLQIVQTRHCGACDTGISKSKAQANDDVQPKGPPGI